MFLVKWWNLTLGLPQAARLGLQQISLLRRSTLGVKRIFLGAKLRPTEMSIRSGNSALWNVYWRSRDLPLIAFIPQSITTAPDLIQSPRTIFGWPMATTRMSARAQTSLRCSVFEWQTVTVAWFHLSSSAQGVPTILDRPNTTASFPTMLMPVRLINSRTPFGVQGRRPPKSPTAILPSLIVFKPSTSFSETTASVTKWALILVVESNGICTMIPWKRGSRLSLLICLISTTWEPSVLIKCLEKCFTPSTIIRLPLWSLEAVRVQRKFRFPWRLSTSCGCRRWNLRGRQPARSRGRAWIRAASSSSFEHPSSGIREFPCDNAE